MGRRTEGVCNMIGVSDMTLNQKVHWSEVSIYFTKSQHVATSSFIPVGNHQATDTKINKLTIIVLESADPYLPDRVEFKHTSLLNLRQDMLFI